MAKIVPMTLFLAQHTFICGCIIICIVDRVGSCEFVLVLDQIIVLLNDCFIAFDTGTLTGYHVFVLP